MIQNYIQRREIGAEVPGEIIFTAVKGNWVRLRGAQDTESKMKMKKHCRKRSAG